MKFYCLTSKTQKRYHLPFLAEDDKDAISKVTSMVVASNDQSLVLSLDDLYLFYLGAVFDSEEGILLNAGYDSVSGIVTAFVPYVVLDDLVRNLPLPPMIKAKVNKLYGFDDSFLDKDKLYGSRDKISDGGDKLG